MSSIKEWGKFINPATGEIITGEMIPEENKVRLIKGSLLDEEIQYMGQVRSLEGLVEIPPIDPAAVFAAAVNYPKHAKESRLQMPKAPRLFRCAPSCLIANNGCFIIPEPEEMEFGIQEPYLDPEPELVAVIGKNNAVIGYSPGNDLSERWGYAQISSRNIPWTLPESRGTHYEMPWHKNLPTFKGLGRLYRGPIDPYDLKVECIVNGKFVQTYYTGDMIFKIDALIARIQEVYEWEELPMGTLIYTGVGPGIGFNIKEPEKSRPSLKAGDEVIVKLPFGQLRNRLINKQ